MGKSSYMIILHNLKRIKIAFIICKSMFNLSKNATHLILIQFSTDPFLRIYTKLTRLFRQALEADLQRYRLLLFGALVLQFNPKIDKTYPQL